MPKQMRAVKERLYSKHGCRCEVCKKEFKKDELTGHHIIMRCKGGKITEGNILIACKNCHFKVINKLEYDSEEYWDLMNDCLEHRKKEPR